MHETEETESWGLYDIAVVSAILLLARIAFVVLLPQIPNIPEKVKLTIALYFTSLTILCVPVIWVRIRHQLGISALGLRKGRWGRTTIIAVGALSAVVYFILASLLFYGRFILPRFDSGHIIAMIKAPVSFIGFPVLVLSPIGEEIYFRGFLYEYFLDKLGKFSGLILQAAIFSIAHVTQLSHVQSTDLRFFVSTFATGIVLGLLYRISNSLYPSIVFHLLYNYAAMIYIFA